MNKNIFTHHPHSVGETYFEHLKFTVFIFVYLIITAFATLTHGLIPFLFTTTGSARIRRLNDIVQSRIHKPQQEAHY